MLDLVRSVYEQGKILAGTCHGPRVLVSAGILEGKTTTCFPVMREGLVEAGADYTDEPVAADGPVITSRVPDDIPAFNKKSRLLRR